MSSHIVEPADIDVLINAAARYGPISTADQARAAATMLWEQNYRSVNYRYSENDTPPHDHPLTTTEAEFDPIALLKAIRHYAHQASDTPDWHDTDAYRWCEALRTAIEDTLPAWDIRLVPYHDTQLPAYRLTHAYDNAPWGVTSLDQMPTRAPRSTTQ